MSRITILASSFVIESLLMSSLRRSIAAEMVSGLLPSSRTELIILRRRTRISIFFLPVSEAKAKHSVAQEARKGRLGDLEMCSFIFRVMNTPVPSVAALFLESSRFKYSRYEDIMEGSMRLWWHRRVLENEFPALIVVFRKWYLLVALVRSTFYRSLI